MTFTEPILSLFSGLVSPPVSLHQQNKCQMTVQELADMEIDSVKFRNEASVVRVMIPSVKMSVKGKSGLYSHYINLMKVIHQKRSDYYWIHLSVAHLPDTAILNEVFQLMVTHNVSKLFISERCEKIQDVLFSYSGMLSIKEFICRVDKSSKTLLTAISQMKSLESLKFLPGSVVSHHALLSLKELPNLRELSLPASSAMIEIALNSASSKSINSLTFYDPIRIPTNASLFPNLSSISVIFTESDLKPTHSFIYSHRQTLKSLSIAQGLYPTRVEALTRYLKYLSSHVPNIESLYIGINDISTLDLEFLSRYPNLKRLEIEFTDLENQMFPTRETMESIAQVISELHKIESFKFKVPLVYLADLTVLFRPLFTHKSLTTITFDTKITSRNHIHDRINVVEYCTVIWKELGMAIRARRHDLFVNGKSSAEIERLTSSDERINLGCVKLLKDEFVHSETLQLAVPFE